MATPKFAWGIDIGNRALKAIRLIRDGDGLRIDDIEVIEHDQVLSNSGDNRDSLIQSALANFAQRHPTKGGVVSVGVSGQSSFARFIKLPPVEEKKIPEIVRFEAIQQIPFQLDDVEWSYQLFRQSDSPDVEVGIFAMRKELVNQQIKFFEDLDMNVQVVQMNPLAVYNGMYYDSRLADGTTMILDLGAENADLIIADGDSVWLRSVPIGGNNFTEALVKAFKLNFAKAEELKRNAQTSKYARQIFQAMRPIFADLVAEIQRSIGFYSSVHRDSRIKRIIALGNTFRLPTLQKYLQQNLQIEVERLDGFHAGAPDDGRLAALLNENIASMAGAYGLALQAMGQGKITSSLLPREIQQATLWQSKTKWFAVAASLFVAAAAVKFGAGYYIHRQGYDANAEVRTTVDAIVADAQRNDGEWETIQYAGGADKQRILNVSSLTRYQDAWADIWYDITQALPPQTAAAPDKLAQIPRQQREQVFVDSFATQFYGDIGYVLSAPDNEFKELAFAPSMAGATGGRAGGGGERGGGGGRRPRGGEGGGEGATEEGAPATQAQRGFLITLQVTSPNRNASTLVDTKVIRELTTRLGLAKAVEEKKPYYVARGMIVEARQIKDDAARMGELKGAADQRKAAAAATYNPEAPQNATPTGRPVPGSGRTPARRGFGGAPTMPRLGSGLGGGGGGGEGGAPANPGQEVADDSYNDPLFPKESMVDDWQLTVLLAVVLDPTPVPKAAEEAPAETPAPAPEQAPAALNDRLRIARRD